MKATQRLHDLGQSPWVENITCELLMSSTLRRYSSEWMNIFEKARAPETSTSGSSGRTCFSGRAKP